MPKVSFDTHVYEVRYGRSPRGRGSWAFCPTEYYNGPQEQAQMKFFQGTFEDARKQARTFFQAMAQEIGLTEIEVTVGT